MTRGRRDLPLPLGISPPEPGDHYDARVRARALVLCSVLLACGSPPAPPDASETDGGVDATIRDAARSDAGNPVIVVPDEHVACRDRDPMRRPFFGDLHVHTRLSFDAAIWGNRSGPREAYRFARGEEVEIAPYDAAGVSLRRIQLRRPLDFAAVTDHSEFLRETTVCNDPSSPGYGSRTCEVYRRATALPPAEWANALVSADPERPDVCLGSSDVPACEATLVRVWQEIQAAAEEFYDRSDDCAFTTFVGYEWSAATGVNNLHRNVIFRNASVPREPISYIETPTPTLLWNALTANCLDTGTPCDVLAIPHNSNLGGGVFFVPETDEGAPYTREDAAQRARLEPLVEIFQHKGSSECLTGAVDPLASEDPLCQFEAIAPVLCTAPDVPAGCTNICSIGGGAGFTGECVEPRDFVRAALRTGLSEWSRTGVNPFELGFIGSTDTHSAIPGAVDEDDWPGHVAEFDADAEGRLRPPGGVPVSIDTNGPGGLAVLWAEENARDSLFDAMRRRETYATSGPRMIVRFFGGWTYPDTVCSDAALAQVGYEGGVAMGGELPPRALPDAAPRFIVSALEDELSAPLQRIQIVKGWLDGDVTHEQVYEVAGDPVGGTVDLLTCEISGGGFGSLCEVWTDPDFDPSMPAFYYARVIEGPTCRWSHRLCLSEGVDCATQAADSPLRACCDGSLPETVQERAWTSPIWYLPSP
jgi:hypothetical protein